MKYVLSGAIAGMTLMIAVQVIAARRPGDLYR
jgi:hypothetical protein